MGKTYRQERTAGAVFSYKRPSPGVSWDDDYEDEEVVLVARDDDEMDDVFVYSSCSHLGTMYTTRFGDICCEDCDLTLGWHPALVREGIYGGAPCVHQDGDCEMDCGTKAWTESMLQAHQDSEKGRELLAFGKKWLQSR